MRGCSICHAPIGPHGECGCGEPLVSRAEWEASLGSEESETIQGLAYSTDHLRADADEIEGCGGGNEAALMRWAADALEAAEAREKRLREALERIEPVQFGLPDMATDEERAEYWKHWCFEYRRIARAALRDEGGEG